LVVGGVVLLYRRNRTAFFWAVFAIATCLPTANLLFPIGAIMAERFLYVPSIGLLACLVLAAFAAGKRLQSPKLAPAVLGVLIAAFALRTWARNADWQTDLSLARSAAETSSRSFKSHHLLASAMYAADESHGNVDAVLAESEKAMAILDPLPDRQNMSEVYRLAGDCYLIQGDRSHTPDSYRRALAVLQRGVAVQNAARERELERLREEGKSAKLLGASPNDDLYRLLSMAYLRLGDGDKAFDAAVEARKHEPLSPPVYTQLAQVLSAGGQPEDAATALMEGMLLTSDFGLRQQLLDLYRSGTGDYACAAINGPNGPAINPKCAVVHRNLCEASVDAIRIRLDTGRSDLAAELKQSFLNDYGCPPEPLNQVLPGAGGAK